VTPVPGPTPADAPGRRRTPPTDPGREGTPSADPGPEGTPPAAPGPGDDRPDSGSRLPGSAELISVLPERVQAVAARVARRVPGEEGVWVFILGDMAVFTVIFATFLYYRGEQPELFNAGRRTLEQSYGVINTVLLLTSSLNVAVGVSAVRRRHTTVAPWLFAGALLCGFGFSAMKFLEYGEKLRHHITPATDSFYMYYYVLTGLHFFHLVLGMVALGFLIRTSRRPDLTRRQFAFIEGGACYWHMVDLLWIVLFPLLYLIE
jgi:nitric oxide reductase NorE protein